MAYLPKGQFIDKLLVRIGGDDNFELFLKDKEEISLIKFIAKYQCLNVNSAKYFLVVVDIIEIELKI